MESDRDDVLVQLQEIELEEVGGQRAAGYDLDEEDDDDDEELMNEGSFLLSETRRNLRGGERIMLSSPGSEPELGMVRNNRRGRPDLR